MTLMQNRQVKGKQMKYDWLTLLFVGHLETTLIILMEKRLGQTVHLSNQQVS